VRIVDLQDALRELPHSSDSRTFGRGEPQRALLGALACELGVSPVRVDDLTESLGLTRGKVFAVRWDLTTGEIGFKQPVMASLLLFHLWRRRVAAERIRVLIDGGNVNTGLALAYLASRLDLRAEHVLSRHFPEDICTYILERGAGRLQLTAAPPSASGKEREFYSYLLELMSHSSRRYTHLCFWHAKYCGYATRWLGEAFAETWYTPPDDIVLGLGSGSTLEGYAIPLKHRFGGSPRVVIAEHNASRLLTGFPSAVEVPDLEAHLRIGSFRPAPSVVPHMVLGPHYDEVNPLIRPEVLSEIDAVAGYTDSGWQDVSVHCQAVGMPVGNSSAANLVVSRQLAAQGRTVFTFVYEPLRDFYIESLHPTSDVLQASSTSHRSFSTA
jgi:cysteine synthase